MPHKLRKTRKKRGSRTCGYGRVGQHRKTSSKGMRKPGRHKHGWTYVIKYEPNYFGKRGFTSPKSLRRRENVINVGELEEMAEKLASAGMLPEKDGKPFIDLEKLGYTKLLGEGEITKPLIVRISSYSKTANEKLQNIGGQILRET